MPRCTDFSPKLCLFPSPSSEINGNHSEMTSLRYPPCRGLQRSALSIAPQQYIQTWTKPLQATCFRTLGCSPVLSWTNDCKPSPYGWPFAVHVAHNFCSQAMRYLLPCQPRVGVISSGSPIATNTTRPKGRHAYRQTKRVYSLRLCAALASCLGRLMPRRWMLMFEKLNSSAKLSPSIMAVLLESINGPLGGSCGSWPS